MINYAVIADAVKFYIDHGYEYVTVPWSVDKDIASLYTDNDPSVLVNGQALVGSAEQSFVQMIERGELSHGRYVAVSPCFRDDDVDDMHVKEFMKVELIDVSNNSCSSLIDDAYKFMSTYKPISVCQTATNEFDLQMNGIEIGSYGSRSRNNNIWSYGTGVAEPRFTRAINSWDIIKQ
jgi:hypothetical protein